MKRFMHILLLCYVIDIILFYLPGLVVNKVFNEDLNVLFGVWGMQMEVFYQYGFLFLFLIVVLNFLVLKIYSCSSNKVRWFEWIILIALIYLLFIGISTLFVSLYMNLYQTSFEVSGFVKDYVRIFYDAFLLGPLIIVFSPITYLIFLNHYLIIKKYKSL